MKDALRAGTHPSKYALSGRIGAPIGVIGSLWALSLAGSTTFSQDVLEFGVFKGYRVKVIEAIQRNLHPNGDGELVAKPGYDWVRVEVEFEADDPPAEAHEWLEYRETKHSGVLDSQDIRLVERGDYEAVPPHEMEYEGKSGASTSLAVDFDEKRERGKAELWFVVPDEFHIRAATLQFYGQHLYLNVEALEVLRRLDDHAWE